MPIVGLKKYSIKPATLTLAPKFYFTKAKSSIFLEADAIQTLTLHSKPEEN